jgi:hypothetical protein
MENKELKKELLICLTQFIGNHLAFLRTISQIFLLENLNLIKDEEGVMKNFIDFLNRDKISNKLHTKFVKIISDYKEVLESKESTSFIIYLNLEATTDILVTSPLNEAGDFVSHYFLEEVKEAFSKIISLFKETEGISNDVFWKQ